jgi:2-methylcitrate dehydratase
MSRVVISESANQALELAKYAKMFMAEGKPAKSVLARTQLFHLDSVVCGLSALNLNTNAPILFRKEAMANSVKDRRPGFAKVFGHKDWVPSTLAIVANSSAVREWDSNGTVFGYSAQDKARQAGEFGHNDFYPVVMAAACENKEITGAAALKAMTLLDEIRGRLCEVFSLKTYKIDHVVHGGIASIVTYGTLMGASEEQIESAIGMFVAHYIPFRAIRAGKQISDSKGASAALSTEAAITCMRRSMQGFLGPRDIFNNPEAIFRLFTKAPQCPFKLHLSNEGEDFAVMGMHFKLGLYEHQSAGALEAVQALILKNGLAGFKIDDLKSIEIVAYEPAFGIIGGKEKKNPTTRQSADHSMAYIVATLLNKASKSQSLGQAKTLDAVWKSLMLMPEDYSHGAVFDKDTRRIMERITFTHGGAEYDSRYPEGIPTSVRMQVAGKNLDSGMVMFPSGHSRNTAADLPGILDHKFGLLSKYLKPQERDPLLSRLRAMESLSNQDLCSLFDVALDIAPHSIDSDKYTPL